MKLYGAFVHNSIDGLARVLFWIFAVSVLCLNGAISSVNDYLAEPCRLREVLGKLYGIRFILDYLYCTFCAALLDLPVVAERSNMVYASFHCEVSRG